MNKYRLICSAKDLRNYGINKDEAKRLIRKRVYFSKDNHTIPVSKTWKLKQNNTEWFIMEHFTEIYETPTNTKHS